MPWPVAQGTIIARFGKQPHPVLKEVFVNNNGIDIATTGVTSARAVFDGEVTGVTNIPGSGWLVIVRHGDYLTVYAKLEETYVKQGDKVKTKQNIGKISEDMDEGQRLLHFEVWQSGIGKTNPETWILNGEDRPLTLSSFIESIFIKMKTIYLVRHAKSSWGYHR